MRRNWLLAATLAFLATACGGNAAASCTEYASEVRTMIDSDVSAAELTDFIDGTQEHVAQLIANDPDHAGPCVEAVLEAAFMAGFAEIEELLDE
jgi:hypothetical protein